MLFLCSQDVYLYFDTSRPLSDEETTSKTPVVISCNERRREVAATQVIANKQIDRTFAFDKVIRTSSTVT
jgi:kinesin family protein 11